MVRSRKGSGPDMTDEERKVLPDLITNRNIVRAWVGGELIEEPIGPLTRTLIDELHARLTTAEAERDAVVRERDELRADIDKTHTIALEVMRERDAARRAAFEAAEAVCRNRAKRSAESDSPDGTLIGIAVDLADDIRALRDTSGKEQETWFERQLRDPDVQRAFNEETRALVLDDAIAACERLADSGDRQELTPEESAREGGIYECVEALETLRDASGAR